MRKFIKEFLDNCRLKKRLVIFMVALIFVPIFVLNILFSLMYVRFYNNKIMEGYDFIQRESYANLNYKLNLYQAMIDRTAYNRNISGALEAVQDGSMLSAYNASVVIDAEIENITLGNSMEEVYQFLIYPLNPNMRVMGRYMSSFDHIAEEEWVQDASNKAKYIFFENKMGNNLLSIAQVLYYTDEISGETEPLALVKMEIKLDSILKNSISDTERNFGMEILQDGQICYTYKPITAAGENLYMTEKTLMGEGLQIRYIFDKTPQIRAAAMMILGFLFLGAVLLSVLTGLIFHFSNGINARMKEIFRKLKKLEVGDFALGPALNGKDEFAQIDRGLESMAAKLQKSINEQYIMETERKKAELLALQMQINPHFMFNTLETINSIAKQEHCPDISFISQKMGEILRYNISSSGEYVRLRQEIEHIGSYLSIQKIRYGDRFDVFYDIPPELENCMVLKFILQPVVENTIKYAVQKGAGNYMIAITAEADGEMVTISVQDDGAGMTEARLREVQENLENGSFSQDTSIGLKNVHSRIRIAYGPEYGVSVFSREHVGTRVLIRFPLKYETGGRA
ncbi:MAG TPA: sensor histidine kinase [Candidatus Avimonoglobus intestinipullorum]|uniref:Sensor histidine kinase n=1 Tax=Candidatus Avimonoglobus intestinipullorum TaxID=2840699 RepID=A0A9D1S703_9FIRM|nr:sensor histidine kinase [Candidatus Avimonoglobus intestinipullorum]